LSGELAAILSALLWSMASVLLTVGVRRLHVLPLNLLRCLISTAFFWALLPFFGGWSAVAAIPARAWLWLAVSVVMFLVVGDTLYFHGMGLAGVSWVMPVASIYPLWAVLLAAFFLDEPLTWHLLAGTALVVVGVVLVSRTLDVPATHMPADRQAHRKGLLLAVVASVLWAVGQVALKPATEGVDPVVANCVRQPLGALMLLILNLATARWHALRSLDLKSCGVIAVASLVGTGLGSVLFIEATQLAGAGRTAVLTSTSPLLALPFSILLLHERPNRWTVFGTVLTTVGVGLVA
jgi:uncharacterized membrane protein